MRIRIATPDSDKPSETVGVAEGLPCPSSPTSCELDRNPTTKGEIVLPDSANTSGSVLEFDPFAIRRATTLDEFLNTAEIVADDYLGIIDADVDAVDDEDEENWRDQALCSQTDPEAFFPEKGGSTREAKKVCLGCPVRSECLEYALSNDERFGIWGGLSERERRRLKREAA